MPLSRLEQITFSAIQFLDAFNKTSGFTVGLPAYIQSAESNSALCLSNFSFNDKEDDEHCIRHFFRVLHQVFPTLWRLTFFDLSVELPVPLTDPLDDKFNIKIQRLTFRDVSTTFFGRFYSSINAAVLRTDIINCSIPVIQQKIRGLLHVENVPPSNASHDRSLQNILSAWTGLFLEVWSCPTFNDDVLAELSSTADGSIVAPELVDFQLQDCDNFSPSAMRRFLQFRADMKAPLKRLWVKGRCPKLSDEDREWFAVQETEVLWVGNERQA